MCNRLTIQAKLIGVCARSSRASLTFRRFPLRRRLSSSSSHPNRGSSHVTMPSALCSLPRHIRCTDCAAYPNLFPHPNRRQSQCANSVADTWIFSTRHFFCRMWRFAGAMMLTQMNDEAKQRRGFVGQGDKKALCQIVVSHFALVYSTK